MFVSRCPPAPLAVPITALSQSLAAEGAAAEVRLGFCCYCAHPASHPDAWMQLLLQDSLQQLSDL